MKNIMKQTCYLLLMTLTAFLPLACERENTEQPDEFSAITPLVCSVGISHGAAVTRIIGQAGGSLQSPDGRMIIEVPEGALASNTTVGIEPVSNTNIAGIGAAFRLTPHGKVFSKPV